jgi:hypothetical protein
MSTVEFRKIIFRQGPTLDLPGEPLRLLPAIYHSPLDIAEIAFGNDQGRIFIGPDLSAKLPQSVRVAFPYQNIEIVGENSRDAFANMHGDRLREDDARDHYAAVLDPSASLAPVLVNMNPYVIPVAHTWSQIDYLITDEKRVALRQGRLTVVRTPVATTVTDNARLPRGAGTLPTTAFAEYRLTVNNSGMLVYRSLGLKPVLLWFRRSSGKR